jgi:hypothetical protein
MDHDITKSETVAGGFANSGGLVFIDESAEDISTL